MINFFHKWIWLTEALILWPHDVKSQLIEKDSDAGKDWRQNEKGAAKDEMVRKHHWLACSVTSVVSDSQRPHGLWPARLLCPWDSPSRNTGVGCCFLLHHRLIGHEFEQTLGDSGGQRSLVCCSPLGHRVRHDLVTEQQQQQFFFLNLQC